jgi:hypothetical protein
MLKHLSTLVKYQARRIKTEANKITTLDPTKRIKFTEEEILEMGKADFINDRTLKGIFKDKVL